MSATNEALSGWRLIGALAALAVTWGTFAVFFGAVPGIGGTWLERQIVSVAMSVSVAVAVGFSIAGIFGRWWPLALVLLVVSLAHGLVAFIAVSYAFGYLVL